MLELIPLIENDFKEEMGLIISFNRNYTPKVQIRIMDTRCLSHSGFVDVAGKTIHITIDNHSKVGQRAISKLAPTILDFKLEVSKRKNIYLKDYALNVVAIITCTTQILTALEVDITKVDLYQFNKMKGTFTIE